MPYYKYTIEDYKILFEAFDDALDDDAVSMTDFLISRGILKTILELLKKDFTGIVDKDCCIINKKAHDYIVSFLDVSMFKFKKLAYETEDKHLSRNYFEYVDLLNKASLILIKKRPLVLQRK